MALLERSFTGDFDYALSRLNDGILQGSVTATLEESCTYTMGPVRVAVQMYERYSAMGGNRVALCLTLTGERENLHLTAITAGGSQAMFFKINTWGEESFLDTLAHVVDRL